MIHEYKINPIYFHAMKHGLKSFDIRQKDSEREPVNVGDEILFLEFDIKTNKYTTRKLLCLVTYILVGSNFTVLEEDYFIMSLKILDYN